METSETIEACPFCGSSDTGVYYDTGRRYVSCECGAKGPIAETYEEAIIKWNRRPKMANENETVADIVAEMKRTKYGDEDCSVKWCLHKWADRIEAAWKRERESIGNGAAMCEALELCYRIIHCAMVAGVINRNDANKAMDAHHSALSAPARNCDRLSAEQCKKIFEMEMGIYLPQEATDRDRDIARCTAYGVIDALFAQSTERKGECDDA